jgi:hypothetical protein
MIDIQPREPERSEEYTKLLEELKQSFVSAANMAVKLYEQGKKDGLSNEVIRKDIEATLEGVVKERRLREILPLELKRSYTLADDSAMSAELDFEGEHERNLAAIAKYDEELKSELGIDVSDMPMSTYDEIMDKVWAIVDAIRAKLIPDMCDALHRERPRLKERGIKNIVAHDLMDTYPGVVHDKYLLSWTIPKQTIKRKK